ncbi:MAG: serine/threonine protein kinase [Gammaproteobacteria bacterium]|nr:serine/threonine protein kinase [Gammaproteobacteria bacterium]
MDTLSTRIKEQKTAQSQQKTRLKPRVEAQDTSSLAGADVTQTGLQPGVVIKQRFLLQERLGEGGMGVVFTARDLLQEEVSREKSLIAIKFLSEGVKDHPNAFRMLQQECKKSQDLAHPNIVTVHDFDRDVDLVYLTMELLSGEPLEAYLSEHEFESLPLKEIESILTDIVVGLSYAHQHGIVHSDLKPENIFLTERCAKILDFGIARAIQQSDESKSNIIAYTPAYASREMIRGAPPHVKDDIYALACITYRLLAGQHPFGGKSAEAAYSAQLTPKPIDGLGSRQWQALLRGLSFDLEERPESAEAFLLQLLPKRRQPWMYAAFLALATALVFAYFVAFKAPELVEADLFLNPGPENPLSNSVQQQINDHLEVAEVHMMVGRLISPPGGNALDEYQKILQLQPFDRQAIKGLEVLLEQMSDQAINAIEAGELSRAEVLTTTGLEVFGKHEGLLAIKQQLSELRSLAPEGKNE